MPSRSTLFLSFALLSVFVACGGSDDKPKGTLAENPGSSGASGSGTSGQGQGGSSSGGSGDAGNSAAGTSASGNNAGGTEAAGSAGANTGGTEAAGSGGAQGGAAQGGAAQGGTGGAVNAVGGGTGVGGEGGNSGAGGSVPDPTPQCNPGIPWNPNPLQNEKVLPPNDFGALQEDRSLAAVSPDALTIVWHTPDSIYYSDRADLGAKFETYSKLPASLETINYPAPEKVALSPDRKRMIVVNLDRKRFGQITRANPGEAFSDALLESPFQSIHDALQADEYLADPILTSDDKTLYFAVYKGDNSSQIHTATRADTASPWETKGPLKDPGLDSPTGPRKRLWWVSADQLTFFLYDPTTKEGVAGWRKNIGKPTSEFKTIGQILSPHGASTCLEVYYTAPNSEGLLEIFHITGV